MTLEKVFKWINAPIVHIGGTPLTLGGILTAFGVVIASFVFSRILQKLLENRLRKQFNLSSGVTYAILRFLHYGILVLGVLIASQCVGLNLGSLAVIFGFLSVGIGFGLQNVTSNFIAGIILLVERPISVGDLVSVDNQIGKVSNINMRSTIIMTLDNVAMIVPNSKFIEERVTNWSIKDVKVRIHIPVGVAYGSDIPRVKAALLKVADNHPGVMKTPAPIVRFVGFGNSSLDFKLLVWMNDPLRQFDIASDLNFAIDDIFRKEKITIPFPQRDLHLIPSKGLEQVTASLEGRS